MSGDMLERLVLLPLTGGCISRCGTEVLDQRCARRSRSVGKRQPPRKRGDEDMSSLALLDESMTTSAPGSFIIIRKSNTYGVQRFLKNVKSISQLFAFKDETDAQDLQIGQPTNVKHITHIGWNRPATSSLVNSWEALLQTPKIYLQ